MRCRGNKRPDLTARRVIELLRQGRAARVELERDYARLRRLTSEDLAFVCRRP